MMNETERKAVELLREEFAKVGISEVSLNLPVDAACVRAIARALEQVRRTVQLYAWKPIETVPNTSEVVLFCDKRGNRWVQCAHSWDIPECGLPASYWRPLPAAPEQQGGAKRPGRLVHDLR